MEIEALIIEPYLPGQTGAETTKSLADGSFKEAIRKGKERIAEQVLALKAPGILGVNQTKTDRTDTIALDIDPTKLEETRIALAGVLNIPDTLSTPSAATGPAENQFDIGKFEQQLAADARAYTELFFRGRAANAMTELDPEQALIEGLPLSFGRNPEANQTPAKSKLIEMANYVAEAIRNNGEANILPVLNRVFATKPAQLDELMREVHHILGKQDF